MKEKESGPEPMWLYVNPVLTELNYVEMRKEAIPTPREAQVWFQLDGKRESACVPLHTVNEQRQTVTAALVGECQGKIVVSFPPTYHGRTRFAVEETDLGMIVAES